MEIEPLPRIGDRAMSAADDLIASILADEELEFVHGDSEDNILAHHGIKGMRWGIRRPRGADGTVGGSGSSSKSSKTVEIAKKGARGFGKASLATGKGAYKAGRATAKVTYKGASKANQFRKAQKAKKELKESLNQKTKTKGVNVKNLSDQELRDFVNRLNLEKQYLQLTSTEKQKQLGPVATAVRGALIRQGTRQLNSVLDGKLDPFVRSSFNLPEPKKKKK